MDCIPWKEGEPIIITVPQETRIIIQEYLRKRKLKKDKKAPRKTK
jgi:hypothetical protein